MRRTLVGVLTSVLINHHDVVVWRDAASGRELARSGRVPASAIQPGYGGSVYFPRSEGTPFKLTPHAAR